MGRLDSSKLSPMVLLAKKKIATVLNASPEAGAEQTTSKGRLTFQSGIDTKPISELKNITATYGANKTLEIIKEIVQSKQTQLNPEQIKKLICGKRGAADLLRMSAFTKNKTNKKHNDNTFNNFAKSLQNVKTKTVIAKQNATYAVNYLQNKTKGSSKEGRQIDFLKILCALLVLYAAKCEEEESTTEKARTDEMQEPKAEHTPTHETNNDEPADGMNNQPKTQKQTPQQLQQQNQYKPPITTFPSQPLTQQYQNLQQQNQNTPPTNTSTPELQTPSVDDPLKPVKFIRFVGCSKADLDKDVSYVISYIGNTVLVYPSFNGKTCEYFIRHLYVMADPRGDKYKLLPGHLKKLYTNAIGNENPAYATWMKKIKDAYALGEVPDWQTFLTTTAPFPELKIGDSHYLTYGDVLKGNWGQTFESNTTNKTLRTNQNTPPITTFPSQPLPQQAQQLQQQNQNTPTINAFPPQPLTQQYQNLQQQNQNTPPITTFPPQPLTQQYQNLQQQNQYTPPPNPIIPGLQLPPLQNQLTFVNSIRLVGSDARLQGDVRYVISQDNHTVIVYPSFARKDVTCEYFIRHLYVIADEPLKYPNGVLQSPSTKTITNNNNKKNYDDWMTQINEAFRKNRLQLWKRFLTNTENFYELTTAQPDQLNPHKDWPYLTYEDVIKGKWQQTLANHKQREQLRAKTLQQDKKRIDEIPIMLYYTYMNEKQIYAIGDIRNAVSPYPSKKNTQLSDAFLTCVENFLTFDTPPKDDRTKCKKTVLKTLLYDNDTDKLSQLTRTFIEDVEIPKSSTFEQLKDALDNKDIQAKTYNHVTQSVTSIFEKSDKMSTTVNKQDFIPGQEVLSLANQALKETSHKVYHMFMAASQTNGLESVGSFHSPLYNQVSDRTQGPTSCSQSLTAWLKREEMYEDGKLKDLDSAYPLLKALEEQKVIKRQEQTEPPNDPGTWVIAHKDYGKPGETFYENGYIMPHHLTTDGKLALLKAMSKNAKCSYMSQDCTSNDGNSKFSQTFAAAFSYQHPHVCDTSDLGCLMNFMWVVPQYINIIRDAILKSSSMDDKDAIIVHLAQIGQGSFQNPPGIVAVAVNVAIFINKEKLAGSNIIIKKDYNATDDKTKADSCITTLTAAMKTYKGYVDDAIAKCIKTLTTGDYTTTFGKEVIACYRLKTDGTIDNTVDTQPVHTGAAQ